MDAVLEKKLKRIPLRVEEALLVVIDADVAAARHRGAESNRNQVIREILKKHYRRPLALYYRHHQDAVRAVHSLPTNGTRRTKTGHL